MLIVVVVIFAVCWGPILINNLLISVGAIKKLHEGYLKAFRQAIFLMSYLNSSLNPVIYGFMSRHFRRGFREAICVCCSRPDRRGQGRFDSIWRSRTRTTSCMHEVTTSIDRTATIVKATEELRDKRVDPASGSIRFKTCPAQSRKIWARRCEYDSQSVTLGSGIEEI